MKVQVRLMSYETASPPSLPMRRWFGFDGSIQMAWTSSWIACAASVSNFSPPSTVMCIPTPPRYRRSGLVGSMRSCEKYIGARVHAGDLLPVLAAVIRAVESRRRCSWRWARATATPTARVGACRTATPGRRVGVRRRLGRRVARGFACIPAVVGRRPLDERVDDTRARAIDVHRDASERSRWQAVSREARPGVAAVGRAPERAPRAATVHAAGGAAALVRRREENGGIGEGDGEVVGPGVLIQLEHLLPRLAAVHRLVDAAIATRTEERAGRRHEDDVVVGRMDDDAVDVPRLRQPHEGEGLPAICRLVDPAPPRGALPVVGLARPHPDEVRIDLRHGDVADRDQPLVLEERFEGRTVAGRLPHAAVRGADVVDRRIGLVDGEVGDAPRHRGGADRAEVQLGEFVGVGNGGLRVRPCRDASKQQERDSEANERGAAH